METIMKVRLKEHRLDDGSSVEVPVFKARRSKSRMWFNCPKCGNKRTHSNEAGYRMSHCLGSGITTTDSVPDCWPDGYIIE